MEASILFIALSLMILLAAAAMRFGVDSREGYLTKERDQVLRGIL